MGLMDFIFIPIILFVALLFLVIGFLIVDRVNDTGVFSVDADAQQQIDNSRNTLLNMDDMMLFLLVGLSLFTVISSYFVWQHPAFFFLGVVLFIIALMLSAFVSNTYETFTNDTQINESANNFTKINFMMGKLPFYLVFLMFITAIVSYIGYQRNY